jgi:hypothetical protein
MLLVLDKVTHSLAAITTLQHVAGLVLVALVYLLGLRLGLGRWAAAGVALVVGLDSWLIVLEQSLLAETACTLLVVASLGLLFAVEPARWWTLALSGLLLALACTVRTASVFAIPAWLVYLVWRHRGPRFMAAALVALVIPLGAYVAEYHHVFGVWGLGAANGWFKYGRVAQIADCSKFTAPPGTRVLCETAAQRARHRPIYYLWNPASPARRHFGDVGGDRADNKALGTFASRAIRARPLAYAGVVLGDFAGFFTPGRSSPAASDVAITFTKDPRTQPPFMNTRMRARYERSYHPAVHAPAGVLRGYAKVFHMPRWLLAVAVLLVLAQLVLVRRRRFAHTPEVLLLATAALLMLLGSVSTSAFVIRYVVPAAPLLLLAGAASASELARARRSGGRTAQIFMRA